MPELVHWNPRLRLRPSGVLWRVALPRRENNFGDLLGPWIARRICENLGLGRPISDEQRLVTVGSIINVAAREGDVIWGSGIHGNFLPLEKPLPSLDVRAVRGPLTAAVLRESGIEVPEVYGDPALLIPLLWSDDELGIRRRTRGTVFAPNYYDLPVAPPGSINPRGNVLKRIRLIASAERVIASSLHAIIIAESYGVPAVLVASSREKLFKYEDYYGGTGRGLPDIASDWRTAMDMAPAQPLENWDSQPLLNAFPVDLWEPAVARG
jgi:pyruvyltransferase